MSRADSTDGDLAPAPSRLTHSFTAHDRIRFTFKRGRDKNPLDARRAYGAFVEEEPDGLGGTVPVATILLTNRECPWRCVFCDLWTNTLDETVPAGAIAEQLRAALADLPPTRWIKLYNAGSFFDPRAIPPGDVPAIAELLASLERVIVESHPALVDERVGSGLMLLRDRLHPRSSHFSSSNAPDALDLVPVRSSDDRLASDVGKSPEAAVGRPARALDSSRYSQVGLSNCPFPRLEVAMGLETVHLLALERMNKGMTLDDFARAADILRHAEIDLRAFVLVQPPFVPPEEAVLWALRSVEFAREQGARLVALIPTRGGNGAMEALRENGDFVPPRLSTLEESLDRALESVAPHGGPLVVADLWDLERFSDCAKCYSAREARLRRMNLSQRIEPRVSCGCASH